jgi:hypothetical protein
MDSTGLGIHGIIDREGNSASCSDPEAAYDHAASGNGRVNTSSFGFELVSEISEREEQGEAARDVGGRFGGGGVSGWGSCVSAGPLELVRLATYSRFPSEFMFVVRPPLLD